MKGRTLRLSHAVGWCAPQFPREFKAIEGVRRSAKLPDLVTKHGSFDKFLANERIEHDMENVLKEVAAACQK
jgi:hypothetical protein